MNKADLYATTLLHYSQDLISIVDPAHFHAATFWDELTAVYQHQFTTFAERPWVFGVVKAGGSPSAEVADGPQAELMQQAHYLLVQLLRRGQELGVVGTDLPEELLLALVMALDMAHDRWLFAHWSDLSPADLEQAAIRIGGDALRRLLIPE